MIGRLIVVALLFTGYAFASQAVLSHMAKSQPVSMSRDMSHDTRNMVSGLGYGLVALISVVILSGDLKNLAKKMGMFAVLLVPFMTGCTPYEPVKLEQIQPNEAGFLIPLLGKTADQVHTDNLEDLKKNIVNVQQVQIPQQWVKTGYFYLSGEWRDAAILIQVDMSPVTREWTADENSGTSNKKEAIWVMTSDQVEFSTGWTCTASIPSPDDAVKFLHQYRNRSLQQVMDTELRARIQTAWGIEVTDLPMTELRSKATPHIKSVVDEVTKYFMEKGIMITNLGITGGFVYKDPTIQATMVRVFNAEQEKSIATAESVAQEERNKTVTFTAKGKADAMKLEKEAEADGIKVVAQAIKEAASGPEYIQIQQLKVVEKITEQWNGQMPVYNMGGSATPMSLLMTVPTLNK